MAYSAEYSEADLSSASIDGVVKGLIVVTQFITLIVLVFLFAFLKKKWESR